MRICFALVAMLFVVQGASAAGQSADASEKPLKPGKTRAIASPITDHFALRVSYVPASIDSELRLDQQAGLPGTDLKVENDLGMSDSTTDGRTEMIIRLRERNRLRVDYFKLTRSGDKVLSTPINFGDQTFNVNDRVKSLIDWRQLGFTYTRSLLRTERFELGAGLGIYLLEAKVRGEVTARNVHDQAEGVGAFPTIALDGTWRISKRWSFNGRAQKFTAHYDQFDGSLADYHGDVQYRWRRNFALGLGYSSLRVNLNVDSKDFPGRFKQNVTGPEFFIRASF